MGSARSTLNRLDLAVGIILLGMSATVFVSMSEQPYWSDFAPGSAFLPFWVAGAGAALALAQVWFSVRQRANVGVEWPDQAGALRVLLTVCALWGFLVAMPWLGVGVSAGGFGLFLLVIVQRRSWLPSLVTTVVTVGMIELIFILWLNVRLPRGVFGF